MGAPRVTLAVCGPTASGKSALSLNLAKRLDGEVINVDSVQVYQELNIGSAKLSHDERMGVPHHVLDIFKPDQNANVAIFRELAMGSIDAISERGKVPILVGGSGLYLTALLHGLADVPATPPEVRDAIARLSAEEQYNHLLQADPITAARLNPRDTQRVSRALEIFRITGKPASEFFARHAFKDADVVSIVIVICRPRDELYRRIDLRARQMVANGLLEETSEILKKYGAIQALETLGYKQARDYLQGGLMSREELEAEIAMNTRRFAKRQMTYWRNEPNKRGWIVRPGELDDAVELLGFDDFPERARKRMKGVRAFDWNEDTLVTRIKERLARPLEKTEVWFVAGVPFSG
jgi:tRNA dimethylallyltransferase